MHHINNDGKTSHQYIRARDNENLSGVGQGSGAEVTIWCFIAAIIEKVSKNYISPITIESIRGKSHHTFITFVDDVNVNIQFRQGDDVDTII